MQEAQTSGIGRVAKCFFAAFAIGFALRLIFLVLALPLLGWEWASLVFEWQGALANFVLALVVYPWVARRLR